MSAWADCGHRWARRAEDARRAIAEGEDDTISWQQYLAESA